jgi:hypothetical protein
MHLATVDGGRLTEALRRMGGIRGGKLGTAHWTFQGKLVIDWAGMREELEADIHETLDGALAVQADAMKHITTILNYKGPTKIRWADDRLVVGMDRIPAELVAEPRSFDLPVDGNPRDLLRAMLRRPREELEQAGFAVECNEVEDKWRKSIRTAAKALAWTGIDEATVEGLRGAFLSAWARTRSTLASCCLMTTSYSTPTSIRNPRLCCLRCLKSCIRMRIAGKEPPCCSLLICHATREVPPCSVSLSPVESGPVRNLYGRQLILPCTRRRSPSSTRACWNLP